MRQKVIFIISILFFIFTAFTQNESSILGTWKAPDLENSYIEVYKESDGFIYGKIVDSDQKEWVNKIILKKVTYSPSDKTWKGTIYSLKRDMSIDATLSLVSDKKLKLDTPRRISLDSAGLENISWVADLEMTGCTVRKNWARGVLFKTPGKVVIRGNTFSPSMSGARNWGEMIWFYESGNTTDVLIEDNDFIDACRVGTGMPVFVINPQLPDAALALQQGFYNRNIKIRNNRIYTFDRSILQAYSVSGLEFTGNEIIQTTTYTPLFPNKPSISITNCEKVIFQNNSFEGTSAATFEVDPLSLQNGVFLDNTGIEKMGQIIKYE